MKYYSLFLLLLSVVTCNSQPSRQGNLKVKHVTQLKNDFNKGTGNSYYLQGMPEGYPIIGESCSPNYEDCTVAFYDENFNLLAGYREPNYPGEKIMNIFSDDLDMDGEPEILMSVRKVKPGMVCLNWDPEKKELREKWIFPIEGQEGGPYHRGCIAGNFTDHPGKEVCFGSSRGTLYLLTSEGKLIITAIPLYKTIQRICTCDIDNDGYDEMVISIGRNPGRVIYGKWDVKSLSFDIIWETNVTAPAGSGSNCYEAIFHPNGHPAGGPAIGAVTERESGKGGKPLVEGSFLLLDMKGNILWQYILPKHEGRSGGCDFKDINGDGIPELLGRYSNKKPGGTGLLIYNNKGERLGKFPGVTASSAGPHVFFLNKKGNKETYFVTKDNVYQILSEQ